MNSFQPNTNPSFPANQGNQNRNFFDGAKSIIIMLPKSPNTDKVAASLSLYLALLKSGKQATIVCPSAMTVEFNNLIAVDKIKTVLNGTGGKNLVISFPYQEGSIEKVSYNIENETFNLVIEPREGYPVITPEMMRYSSTGAESDLIITVGVSNLFELDSIYQNNQELFTSKPVINIDNSSQNQQYGKLNLVDPSLSSVCESTMVLLSQLNINLDPDIATNLLTGITSGSNNFTSKETSINTFESATVCMKSGARKTTPSFSQPQQTNKQPFQSPFQQQPKMQQQQSYSPKPQMKPKQYQMSPRPANPMPVPQMQQQQQPMAAKPQPQETPPDWLKPKIYKGSTLL